MFVFHSTVFASGTAQILSHLFHCYVFKKNYLSLQQQYHTQIVGIYILFFFGDHDSYLAWKYSFSGVYWNNFIQEVWGQSCLINYKGKNNWFLDFFLMRLPTLLKIQDLIIIVSSKLAWFKYFKDFEIKPATT